MSDFQFTMSDVEGWLRDLEVRYSGEVERCVERGQLNKAQAAVSLKLGVKKAGAQIKMRARMLENAMKEAERRRNGKRRRVLG